MLALPLLIAAATPVPIDFDVMAKDAREILAELVAADTTNPPGNEGKAVKLIEKRLKKAKIPYVVTTFAPGRDNIVARIKGDGSQKPMLLLAHLDVVGTAGQTWTVPPHKLTEKDGYLYGRGVRDDLGNVAIDLALALGLTKSKVPLKRDLILAFTGDEESGGAGTRWLVNNERGSIDAEIAFNEGGGPLVGDNGKLELLELQTAEKTYQDFTLTATGTTGHSSVPLPDNAIDALAQGIHGIVSHPFPDRLLPVTRSYFAGRAPLESAAVGEAMAKIAASEGGTLPADAVEVLKKQPSLYALLHTTCVPTMVNGGTRVNALPAAATANVNCRLLPSDTVEATQRALQDAAGPTVKVTADEQFGASGPAPLDGPGPDAVLAAGQAVWPGVKLVPTMSCGADDSRFLRQVSIRAYGFSPIPMSEADDRRAHGIDERIPVGGLRTGVELFYRLVQALNPAG